jgi:hypothetical protein
MKRDWDADESVKVKARDDEIKTAEAAITAWEADPKPAKDKGEKPVKPDKYKAASKPQWLVDALGGPGR